MLGQTRRNHTRDAHLGCSHSPLFPVALDKTVKIEKYEVDATRAPTRAPPADDEVCWICLEGNTNEKADLIRPCKCPRVVHARCMARGGDGVDLQETSDRLEQFATEVMTHFESNSKGEG